MKLSAITFSTLLATGLPSLQAALLIANIGDSVAVHSDTNYVVGDTFSQEIGSVFVAPADDFTISGGNVLLALEAPGEPSNVTLSIFSNDPTNNIPQNSLLELDTVTVSSTSQTLVSFTSSNPSQVFAGGELYWLVLSATDQPNTFWYQTDTFTPLATVPGSLGSFPDFNPFSDNSSWSAFQNPFMSGFVRQTGSPGQFSLEGAIIPEPGSLFIGSALFGGTLLLRRRKNPGSTD